MTPTERAVAALPPHLRRYAVEQRHAAYTPRDHAVWRHVLRRLTVQLAGRAHPSYLAGLAATGIGVEAIPDLDDMNPALERLGWSAIPVRGFLPPAVFTELQSRRVLAIAADVRTVEHVEYTPAPDIVHEAAGHAPLLADPIYAAYLCRCGEAGFRAVAAEEDQAVFEAIRALSVVKEDPAATPAEIRLAEERLAAAAAGARFASEAARASRLYWWTAEYGLVGPLEAPRLYGAGLLSSLGESLHALGPEVRREPLGPECADVAYDITRMQPRLFVARDFEHLFEVLDAFTSTLSFRRGGAAALSEALRARTVVHLVLDGGREVTGRVAEVLPAPGLPAALVRLAGPILPSRDGAAGEGARPFPGDALVAFGDAALPDRGPFDVSLASGLRLAGFAVGAGEAVQVTARLGDRALDVPPWAHLAVARALPSLGGGPADPGAWDRWFGAATTFTHGDSEARARARRDAALPPALAALYAEARRLREAGAASRDRLIALREAAAPWREEWLLREEVEEITTGGSRRPSASARRVAAASPAGGRGTRRGAGRSR
jgi:phenylalanine-4-hydroxylase